MLKHIATHFTFLMLSLASAHAILDTASGKNESFKGRPEVYRLMVMNEKNIDTTSFRLQVPEGVQVINLNQQMGWRYSLEKNAAGQITAITWKGRIHPFEFEWFYLVGFNPRNTDLLTWTVTQNFADGSSLEFDGEAPEYPASYIRLQ